jgi:hypothetical protein
VAELADAHDSKSCGLTLMRVRFSPAAPLDSPFDKLKARSWPLAISKIVNNCCLKVEWCLELVEGRHSNWFDLSKNFHGPEQPYSQSGKKFNHYSGE